VFHAYGHQWPCQLVYHPRKRVGFGFTDGEGCERAWGELYPLIPSLRVAGHHRRLFTLDAQLLHLNIKSMYRLAIWLARRMRTCQKRLIEASQGVNECRVDVGTLRREWLAQLTAQTEDAPRQSKHLADRALAEIILERAWVKEAESGIKDLAIQIVKLEESGEDATNLESELAKMRTALVQTKGRLITMEKAVGVEGRSKLKTLMGNPYLQARMNARALKARIRAKLVEHKFERTKLERVYRRQVLQEKEHAQTKALIHRRQGGIAALILKYNKLVDEMTALRRARKAPAKSVLPHKLDSKKVFRLDVNDGLWEEDPGLGDEDFQNLPRWMTDDNVRKGILFLLQRDRCLEE
ncbi:hypothetical protein BOTBODRAFT_86138, partial [Botryobasidium botryosum FD-172 SS1]